MAIGGTSEVGDMIWEGKGAIKSDTQVTDGGQKGKAREPVREKCRPKHA